MTRHNPETLYVGNRYWILHAIDKTGNIILTITWAKIVGAGTTSIAINDFHYTFKQFMEKR
jgi:hypothetical protein